MKKKEAGRHIGPKNIYVRIVPRVRAIIKNGIIIAALWHLLPIPVTEWLIQRLRLERA